MIFVPGDVLQATGEGLVAHEANGHLYVRLH